MFLKSFRQENSFKNCAICVRDCSENPFCILRKKIVTESPPERPKYSNGNHFSFLPISAFIAFLLIVLASMEVDAKTIWVGKTKPFKSIKNAINAATDGDTILVEAGIYKEGNVVIQKSIVLKGINFPVLDGEKKYEILTVKANDAVIEGFKFQHSLRFF